MTKSFLYDFIIFVFFITTAFFSIPIYQLKQHELRLDHPLSVKSYSMQITEVEECHLINLMHHEPIDNDQ